MENILDAFGHNMEQRLLWPFWINLWTSSQNTIADGLAVAEVGCNAFATCDHHLDKVISITEDWIAIAILRYKKLPIFLS